MINNSLFAGLAGMFVALIGCTSSLDTSGGTIATTFADSLKRLGQPPIKQLIETTPGNTLLARIVGTDRSSELRLVAQNGNYGTWEAEDGSALVLNSGILTATYGLGHDLYSADVADISLLLKTRQNGRSERINRYIDGENQVFLRAYRCTVTNRAAKPNNFTQIAEDCQGVDTSFSNLYVLDPTNNSVWSSRQWVGPQVGYIEIESSKARSAAQDRVIEAIPIPVYDLTKYGG